MDRFSPTVIGDARGFRRLAAIVALSIGAATLFGLAIGSDLLIRWLASSTTMNPITAVLMVAFAAALLVRPAIQRWAIPSVAAVMIAVAALKLWQTATGRPLGFDYLVSAATKLQHASLPDPIALNTALVFLLLGVALAMGRSPRPALALTAQIFAISAIAIAVMALAGFALDAAAINRLTFNRMAINTAVGLSALGMAVLTLTPDRGVMRLLLTQSRAGDLARKALPICLLVPILLGQLRLSIEHDLGLTTGDGVAIMVAGSIVLSLTLLWGCLILLLRSDAELRAKATALVVSEAQYRQAGRIGKMGHWQYDAATERLLWTNEFRALLGLPADLSPTFEVMEQSIHPDDREQARTMMVRARTLGEDWNWHIRLLLPGGQVMHAKSHGICQRSPDGALVSILGVLADVTELEAARRGAEAATRAQAAFLANMSHEIRTPLNGVLGFISLLLDSKLDPSQRRYLGLVDESAKMLLKLLNDILDLSKVEAGQLEVSASPTDLRQTIRHTLRLMAPLAEQKSIGLKSRIGGDFPSGVMIDGARFRQILLNILGNALKFTPQGNVTVRLESTIADDGTPLLRASVEDSGIGIPADRLDAMFSPFVQADTSTSRQFGGSGLGLSISRHLAELMGGTLTLTSVEGQGTTATLSLPLVPAILEQATGHDSPAGVVAGGDQAIGAVIAAARKRPGKSILLVEDLELNRLLVGDMLGRLGHQVDFAENGAEALALAARLAEPDPLWDLILMDVMMPIMNGTDASRAIRALGGVAATIPIITLSANAFEAEIQQSRDAGMDDHIVKPIDFALLSRAIDHWGQSTRSSPRARRRA